jgi:hypothetical protein
MKMGDIAGDLRSAVSAGSETLAERGGRRFRRGRRPSPNAVLPILGVLTCYELIETATPIYCVVAKRYSRQSAKR